MKTASARTLCRLCEQQEANVRAHIIPKSLLPVSGPEVAKIVARAPNVPPKRTPNGIYDSGILCAACEASLSPFDDYGFRFLTTFNPDERLFSDDPKYQCEVIRSFNYRLLKLFCLSVLWRASVSSQSFFERVRLGPYESVVRDKIRRGDPGRADELPTLLLRYNATADQVPTLGPMPVRLGNVNTYRLYMREFTIAIKVDKQPLPPVIQQFAIADGMPLRVCSTEFFGSRESLAAVQAVRTHGKALGC